MDRTPFDTLLIFTTYYLRDEYNVKSFQVDMPFKNLMIFESSDQFPSGILIFFYSAFNATGDFRQIKRVDELRDQKEYFEQRGFKVIIACNYDEVKKAINEYFIKFVYNKKIS